MELILGSQSPRRRELLERMGLEFRVLTAEIDETKYETEDPEDSVRRICRAKARAVAQAFPQSLPLEGKAPPQGADEVSYRSAASSGYLILTSDTIVVLDGRILGKPHSPEEARAMLRALSGREHAVYTAFTLLPIAFPLGGHNSPGDCCEFIRQCDSSADATGNLKRWWHPASPASRMTDEGRLDTAAGNESFEPFTHCEKTRVKFRDLTEAEIDAYVATGEPMDKAGAYGIQGRGAMLVEAIHGDYFTVMGLPVCALAQALKRYGIDPLTP